MGYSSRRYCAAVVLWLVLPFIVVRTATAEPLAEFPRSSPEDTFLKLAATPGWQEVAVKIASSDPASYLALLGKHDTTIPAVLREIVAADLLRALGSREEACKLVRAAAQKVGKNSKERWEDGVVPFDQYLTSNVSLDFSERATSHPRAGSWYGGMTDNLILQRLISCGDTEQAEKEYNRMFAMHERQLAPYRAHRREWEVTLGRDVPPDGQFYDITIHGFGRHQLPFAREFAEFLLTQKHPVRLLKLLDDVLQRIDMDRDAGAEDWMPAAEQPPAEALYQMTEWASPVLMETMTAPEFIEFALSAARSAGKERELKKRIDQRIAAGQIKQLRVKAQLLRQDNRDAAFKAEQRYIALSRFKLRSQLFREALLQQERGEHREAVTLFRRAVAAPNEAINIPESGAHTPRRKGAGPGWLVGYRAARYVDPKGDGEVEQKRFLNEIFEKWRSSCSELGDYICEDEAVKGSIMVGWHSFISRSRR